MNNHRRYSPLFDWRRLVSENKPSVTSPLQRARLDLFDSTRADLEAWSARYDLWRERVEPVAYMTASCLSLPAGNRRASLLARFILWIYSLDDRTDRPQFAPPDTSDALLHVDVQLSTMTRPLFDAGALSADRAREAGLAWWMDAGAIEERGLRVERSSALFGDALTDIYRDLRAAFPSMGSGPERGFVVDNFTWELARLIGVMHQEIEHSLAARRDEGAARGVDMERYLERGGPSTAFPALASICDGFEAEPRRAWLASGESLASGARIIRLANDLGSYEAERDEAKINAVTIALDELGFSPLARYEDDAVEITRARARVSSRIDEEIERFASLCAGAPETPLLSFVRATVAFALAMYEKGNYVVVG